MCVFVFACARACASAGEWVTATAVLRSTGDTARAAVLMFEDLD